ncbi:MAG: hypothetical protein RLZ72_326 [Actinomycetota bacterium]|jgi:uncharacterized protein (DUF1684 family)
MTEAADRFASFHTRREAQVKEPMGSLALVLTQWIDAPQQVWGVPGTWAPREDGQSGVVLTATAADNITVNGELVDGTVTIEGPGGSDAATIVFSDTLRGSLIREGDITGLRVWDATNEWIANYGGIDAYDYNPDWVITGQWKPYDEVQTAMVDKKSGTAKAEVIPGEIAFTHDGHDVSLLTIGTGKALQIVFADSTNDSETYSVGRFLFVVPNPDGTVTMDFNLAVLPPCAFSYNFNCPIPPKQNRLEFPIRAGEKNVVDTAGELLHH